MGKQNEIKSARQAYETALAAISARTQSIGSPQYRDRCENAERAIHASFNRIPDLLDAVVRLRDHAQAVTFYDFSDCDDDVRQHIDALRNLVDSYIESEANEPPNV